MDSYTLLQKSLPDIKFIIDKLSGAGLSYRGKSCCIKIYKSSPLQDFSKDIYNMHILDSITHHSYFRIPFETIKENSTIRSEHYDNWVARNLVSLRHVFRLINYTGNFKDIEIKAELNPVLEKLMYMYSDNHKYIEKIFSRIKS